MKRALLALFLVASPAFAQANGWAEMANGWGEIQTVPGFTTLPLPAGCTTGSMATFLGSLTCVPGLTFTSNTLTIPVGTGAATAKVGGTLFVTTTPATTTGTTEQTLATYPMPANTMATNGRGVRITASFTHAANTNGTIAYVKFGGQQVAIRANSTSGATTRITAEVIRTGAATQWSAALAAGATTVQALSGALTVDLTAAVAITATATTGTAAGDLTLDLFMVEAI